MLRSSVNDPAPSTAKGTDKSTAKGIDQLSYCAAKNRYTKMMARPKMKGAALPAAFSWKVTPDHS